MYVGTAGWSIPRASVHRFRTGGTHLQRYACVLPCVEINSSFYRSHALATYARWADSVPGDFRFAVKVPRSITHDRRLRRSRALFERFLMETSGLGDRRGTLLVQLPPSFAFDPRVAARFFEMVRVRYEGDLVCEPRHPTWFGGRAETLMQRYAVARAATDPRFSQASLTPGGWPGLAYFRLHGTPRTYWSSYGPAYLRRLAHEIRRLSERTDAWCVFDNTASGAAMENAWELMQMLAQNQAHPCPGAQSPGM